MPPWRRCWRCRYGTRGCTRPTARSRRPRGTGPSTCCWPTRRSPPAGNWPSRSLHELAHQWLYLIEDIWPLQRPGAATLTLPSGTRDRSPAEVLGAAHVAAVLIRLYRHTATGQPAGRIRALTGYGTGCLDLAGTVSGELTEAGNLIAQRLKEAF